METSERFTVGVTGGTIVGERCGCGPGLILLHAGVADRRMWNGNVPFLATRHTVISYDRRGFSETCSEDVAFSHMSDLDDVLGRFEFTQVTLIGCSQGGRIAIDYTLAHPGKVTALVLVAPAVSGEIAISSFPDMVQRLLDDLTAAEQRRDVEEVNRIEAHLWLDGPLEPEGRVSGDARNLFLDMNGIALSHPPFSQEQQPDDASERLGQIVVPTLVCVARWILCTSSSVQLGWLEHCHLDNW